MDKPSVTLQSRNWPPHQQQQVMLAQVVTQVCSMVLLYGYNTLPTCSFFFRFDCIKLSSSDSDDSFCWQGPQQQLVLGCNQASLLSQGFWHYLLSKMHTHGVHAGIAPLMVRYYVFNGVWLITPRSCQNTNQAKQVVWPPPG